MNKVFIVDDNDANLLMAKNALDGIYETYALPSAARMFKLLEKIKADLILLDVTMPEMDGYEAIQILKSKPETANIPVIFLTGKTDSDDEIKGLSLGAIDYITKPFKPPLLLKRVEVHLLVNEQKKRLEKQAAEILHFNENLQKMVQEKTEDVYELKNAILKTIAELVEYRDNITGGHIERTQYGLKLLLLELEKSGYYKEEIKDWNVELLLQSCQLHDVGKISISDSVLKKPGTLDNEEFEQMKKHTDYGEEIIEKIQALTKEHDFLKYAKIFAGSHHEKWDGTGYPRGLKGDETPLLGRIMAVVDVYDALVSERPYKKAIPHEDAVEIIKNGSGTVFDPKIVEVFLNTADEFCIIRKSMLNS